VDPVMPPVMFLFFLFLIFLFPSAPSQARYGGEMPWAVNGRPSKADVGTVSFQTKGRSRNPRPPASLLTRRFPTPAAPPQGIRLNTSPGCTAGAGRQSQRFGGAVVGFR
jgi:hypothetical protein